MDKKHIYDELVKAGLVDSFRNDPLWKQAFDLYTSKKREKLSMSCSLCYRKVLEWLKQ